MLLNKFNCLVPLILFLIFIFVFKSLNQKGGAVSNIVVKKNIDVATDKSIYIYQDSNIYIRTIIIDGVKLEKDYLILIKNQTNLSENGIYQIINIDNKSNNINLKKINFNNIKNTIFLIKNGTLNKNTQWNVYNDLYKRFYNLEQLIFKQATLDNNDYKEKHLINSKFWFDSSDNKNIGKPINNNLFSYNNIYNHIFSFNGIKVDLNTFNKDSIKGILLTTHIFTPSIYLLETETKSAFIKILQQNNTCLIDGINKIIVNDITFDSNNSNFTDTQCDNIFNMIYNKPCIIYIELTFPTKNISINKTLQVFDKTTSFIYEIKLLSKSVSNIKDNIYNINSRINLFQNSLLGKNISENVLSYLDGNIIKNKIIKNIIFEEGTIDLDYIQKELLMNKKIINIDLLSTKNINLTKKNNILYKSQQKQIDNTDLQNNFIVLLKNQNNYNENGLYKFINGNFYKLQFDKNMIKNIHFYIKNGDKNKKNYWMIKLNNTIVQKNLAYDKLLNAIYQSKQNNPHISLINKNQKCIIGQEEYDENGEVVALVLPNFDMEEHI